jgi:hypothetical protein
LLVLDGLLVCDVEVSRMPKTGATGSFMPLCPWPSWGLCGLVGNSWCFAGSTLLLVLDGLLVADVEVLPAVVLGPVVAVVPHMVLVSDPECVDGAAAAKPLPRPRAAKPRTPAMAPEAANCLMVLIVFMNCVAFQVSCRAS